MSRDAARSGLDRPTLVRPTLDPPTVDRPTLPTGQALVLAALSGLALALAFPGPAIWPLALVAPALLLLALDGRRFWGGVGVGFVGGLAFYAPLVSWSSRFLGPVPWAALAVVMALSYAAGAGLLALATRWAPRRWPGARGRLVMLPLMAAGLWTARDAVASSWPYGGFAWGRIAQSQSASPLAELVAWLGLAGMGFVLVWWSILALELLRLALRRREPLVAARWAPGARRPVAVTSPRLARAIGLPALGAVLALLMLVPALPRETLGTTRIAAVQPDAPEASYFAHAGRWDVITKALEATRSEVPADARPDAILWPEGSTAMTGPQFSPEAAEMLRELSAEYGGAPILANTVTVDGDPRSPDARFYNTQYEFTAQGGWGQQTSKKRPVPFGEYIPDRDFWYALAPDLIGMVARDYSPAADSTVLELPSSTQAAPARAGVFICFDVIEDGVIRRSILDDDAQVLLMPTNNADFDRTDEAAQQLAFARLRAIETGMTVIQVSTVGMSAAYDGSGREIAALPWFEPGAMIVDAPLASGPPTPAVLLGPAIQLLAAGSGLALLLMAGLDARRVALARRGTGR